MSATAIRSETAIRFDQVSKGFGETMALDDVSLDVPRGAFVTVIGSSGCGKTTLLKTVNALVVPDEGHVLVNGRDTAEADPIELRRSIGYALLVGAVAAELGQRMRPFGELRELPLEIGLERPVYGVIRIAADRRGEVAVGRRPEREVSLVVVEIDGSLLRTEEHRRDEIGRRRLFRACQHSLHRMGIAGLEGKRLV